MKAYTWQEFTSFLQDYRDKFKVVAVRDPSFFEDGATGKVGADTMPTDQATPTDYAQAVAIHHVDSDSAKDVDIPIKDGGPGRFIGVTPLYDRFSAACQCTNTTQFPAGITSSLKRDALLFDCLTVTDWCFVGGNEFMWALPKRGTVAPNQQDIIGDSVYVPREIWGSCIGASSVGKEVAAEVNWLFEQGILQHSPHFELPESITDAEVDLLQQLVRQSVGKEQGPRDEGWAGVSRAVLPLNRVVCMKLERADGSTAVPIYNPGKDADVLAGSCFNGGLGDVAQVVIKAMPQPDELTAWDEIIEFRKDPDARHAALGLRRWMRKIAKDSLPIIEIEEELTWLLGEYERHMRLHKMKVNTGAVETVVTITSEFMEAIANGKYSQATGLFFVAKHGRIALTEAELKAPGREVSYISKAWARVGTTSG